MGKIYLGRGYAKAYRILVILRVVFAFLGTGFLHPDEYFQNGEVTAGSVLDLYALRTWEWDPTFPCRSIVPAFVTTGVPFTLLRYASKGTPSPWALFAVQRSSFLLLSFILDFSVARLVSQRRAFALVLLGASHVMLTFQARPFSNSIEALLVASSLLALQAVHNQRSVRSFSLLAVLCVVGIFTRITFAAFATPIVLRALLLILKPRSQIETLLSSRLRNILPAAALGALTTLLFVSIDSLYFKATFTRPALVPLNFLLYNLSPENLAQHGLHPRWLHVAVNLPIIVGPSLLFAGMQAAWPNTRADKSAKDNTVESTSSVMTSTCLYVIGGSLLVLSIQPHQEPRFLTPLLVPFVVLVANSGYVHRAGKVFWLIFVVFNVALSFLFGVLHQGGVVPSLAHVHGLILANAAPSNIIVYWKTYMPPRHLLAIPNDDMQSGKISITDLAGASVGELQKHLLAWPARHEDTLIYLVAPPFAVQSLDRSLIACFELNKRIFPHLDLDHIPESVEIGLRDGLSLDVRVARTECIWKSQGRSLE